MGEDVGEGDDVGPTAARHYLLSQRRGEIVLINCVPGLLCIGGGTGWLDANCSRASLSENRQQAAVIAADVEHQKIIEVADLFFASLHELTHTVQDIGGV